MRGFRIEDRVAKGVAYLNVTRPNWWQAVHTGELDMYDFRGHVLAQIQGCLVYETKEVVFWPRHALAIHGFMPLHSTDELALLTAEWKRQVFRLWRRED